MKIEEIKNLKRAVDDLHKFSNGGAIRKKNGNIDKYGTGFNIDGRRKMCGSHSIYFDTHYGYYGNSDAYPQIELPSSTHDIFWKCFDEFLNDHQDEILNGVCERMKRILNNEIDTIQKEIDNLTSLMENLK